MDPKIPQRPERLSFGALVKTFLADLANADRGIVGTFVKLTTYPNVVVDTYLYEDRSRFIRPTRYVLFAVSFVAASYLLVQLRFGEPMHEYLSPYYETQVEKIETSMLDQMMNGPKSEDPKYVEFAQSSATKYGDFWRWLMKAATQYSTYFSLAFLPLNALILWLAFPRRGFNFTESIVATGYYTAQATLFSILIIPFLLFTREPDTLGLVLNWVGRLAVDIRHLCRSPDLRKAA